MRFSRRAARLIAGAFALAALLGTGAAAASPLADCDAPARLSADQKDRLLRLAGVVKDELEASGQSVALISRSGIDLHRFGIRYSHAGFTLRASENAPWSVRQLYYACDERRPRLYDQGIAGFLLGNDDPELAYVSLVFVPPFAAADVEDRARDAPLALALLAGRYSANAYPYSTAYQNCNQWVMEMIAYAWGGLDGAADPRARAQDWLRTRGYAPAEVDVGWRPLMWLSRLLPMLHADDHPPEELARKVYRLSLPDSIEAFVRDYMPGTRRVEICRNAHMVVVHRGWTPVGEGCVPGDGDTVHAF